MSILALEWDNRELRGVEADVGSRQVTVRRSFRVAWPEGDLPSTEDCGNAIREEMESAGIGAKRAVICVPRDLAVTRHLDLPDVPAEELATVVRYQTAAKAGTSAEELALDYLPQPPVAGQEGMAVLAATVPPVLLNRIGATMLAAGIEVESITIAPLALAEFVQRIADEETTGPTLAITLLGDRVEILAIEYGTLLFSYGARLTGDSPGEICETDLRGIRSAVSRSLISLDKERPGFEPAKVHVLANSVDHDALVSELAGRFDGKPLSLTDPWERFVSADKNAEQTDPSPWFAAAGLAFSNRSKVAQHINFLDPRKPIPKRDLRKVYLIAAAAAVLLLICGAYFYRWSIVNGINAETTVLQDQKQELDEQINAGQPVLLSSNAIENWKKRGVSPLDEMMRLNKRANSDLVLFKLLQFTQTTTPNRLGTITGDMIARTRTDMENLNTDLNQEPRFAVRPQEIRNQADDPKADREYSWTSKLSVDVQIVDEKKKSDKTKKPVRRPTRPRTRT